MISFLEWSPQLLADAPAQAKPFLQSVNTSGKEWQQAHKPQGMTSDAPGINPNRWGD